MEIKEPEWTAENMNRQKGDTTFKKCGWCVYAGSGSYRYNTMLSGNCNLMKSYRNEVGWDTDCKIISLGKQDIKRIVESKQYEIKSSLDGIKRTKQEIKTLLDLKVENRPPLPDNRGQDFEIGEVVYVFHENKWNRGTVVMGYRHKDGCVSYVLDDYPESKKGWGCGTAVPCVIKKWEYDYFKKNPNEFTKWLDGSDRKYNGDSLPIKDYFKAMYA